MSDLTQDKYENFISLGFFCEVALDLEKLGLRNTSSPFDWAITRFRDNIELMENRFDGFMEYRHLYQAPDRRERYVDVRYNYWFLHDFSKYVPLEKQYDGVKQKYDRRIARFLENIKKPTLFFRYISTRHKNAVGKPLELEWIESDLDRIYRTIRSFNPGNDIVFIAEEGITSDVIKIYNVRVEKGDHVSRSPVTDNTELYAMVSAFTVAGQEDNIKRYNEKVKQKNSPASRLRDRASLLFCKLFRSEYIHNRIKLSLD